MTKVGQRMFQAHLTKEDSGHRHQIKIPSIDDPNQLSVIYNSDPLVKFLTMQLTEKGREGERERKTFKAAN
jgi:hypothetical protein